MKSILTSKTFWFNVLGGAAQVIGFAGQYIPPQYAPIAVGVTALINIILRTVTTQPVSVP